MPLDDRQPAGSTMVRYVRVAVVIEVVGRGVAQTKEWWGGEAGRKQCCVVDNIA